MKRLSLLLALVCGLFAVSACNYDIDLSVDAWTELSFENGDTERFGPSTYGGFHESALSDNDLEWIFLDLTQEADLDGFKTAFLNMLVYDEITGDFLREETYGVVYDAHSGHYVFTDMNISY